MSSAQQTRQSKRPPPVPCTMQEMDLVGTYIRPSGGDPGYIELADGHTHEGSRSVVLADFVPSEAMGSDGCGERGRFRIYVMFVPETVEETAGRIRRAS